jgi:hypothetical protein
VTLSSSSDSGEDSEESENEDFSGLSSGDKEVGRVHSRSDESENNNNEYTGHQDEDDFRQVQSFVPNETPAPEVCLPEHSEIDSPPQSPPSSPTSPTRSPTAELPPATVQLVLKLAKEILKPRVLKDELAKDTIENLSDDYERNDYAIDILSQDARQSGLVLPRKSRRWDVPPPEHYVAYIPLPLNLRELVLAKWQCVLKQMLEVRDTTVTLGILGPECFIVRGSSGAVEVATKIIEQQLVNMSYNPC